MEAAWLAVVITSATAMRGVQTANFVNTRPLGLPLKSGRATRVNLLATRRKASELKRVLEAAGISTAGIVEKEELERLVDSLEVEVPFSLPLVYQMDAAYADFDGQRLLVDTGSAVSVVAAAAAPPGLTEWARVFAERDSPTSLRVTWGDVEDAHGAALTGWSVEWNKTNAEFQRGSAPLGDSTDHDFPYSGSWSRLVGPDAREFRITNLTAGNYYAVGVRAINRQGAAPPP